MVRGADLLSSSSLRLAMPRGLGRGTAAGKPPREKPPPGHVFHGHCAVRASGSHLKSRFPEGRGTPEWCLWGRHRLGFYTIRLGAVPYGFSPWVRVPPQTLHPLSTQTSAVAHLPTKLFSLEEPQKSSSPISATFPRLSPPSSSLPVG